MNIIVYEASHSNHEHSCTQQCIFSYNYCVLCRYIFAKTTVTGLTTFYALYLNSSEQRAYFEYRPEGLDQGSRTLILDGVNVADGNFHHFAVIVYGMDFAFFMDGHLHRSRERLIGALEDGTGVLYIGRKLNNPSRYSGGQ